MFTAEEGGSIVLALGLCQIAKGRCWIHEWSLGMHGVELFVFCTQMDQAILPGGGIAPMGSGCARVRINSSLENMCENMKRE